MTLSIKKIELNRWYMLVKQIQNGYHMEPSDYKELIALNYLVMEDCHEIHNTHMLNFNNDLVKQGIN